MRPARNGHTVKKCDAGQPIRASLEIGTRVKVCSDAFGFVGSPRSEPLGTIAGPPHEVHSADGFFTTYWSSSMNRSWIPMATAPARRHFGAPRPEPLAALGHPDHQRHGVGSALIRAAAAAVDAAGEPLIVLEGSPWVLLALRLRVRRATRHHDQAAGVGTTRGRAGAAAEPIRRFDSRRAGVSACVRRCRRVIVSDTDLPIGALL